MNDSMEEWFRTVRVRKVQFVCLLSPTIFNILIDQIMSDALEEHDGKVIVVVLLLFYVHGKHLRSCRDGQLAQPHFSWAGLDLLSG